jgi:hypothetical protein
MIIKGDKWKANEDVAESVPYFDCVRLLFKVCKYSYYKEVFLQYLCFYMILNEFSKNS